MTDPYALALTDAVRDLARVVAVLESRISEVAAERDAMVRIVAHDHPDLVRSGRG